jgi:acetylglutamate kinase
MFAIGFVASLLNVVTMLFQQLVNKMSPQQACGKGPVIIYGGGGGDFFLS